MWQEKNGELYKHFEFKDFAAAWRFMEQVAEAAETLQHHPRWQNEWNRVDIWLSTHSEGKITEKDHKLAARIDQIEKAGA